MKLDPNCVRDVLMYLEEQPNYTLNSDGDITNNGIWLQPICAALPQYGPEVIFYTLAKLEEGGYLSMTTQWAGGSVNLCCVNYITYRGHEFLETIRPETVWQKTSGAAGKVGTFSLKMIEKVAEGVATAYFKDALGL